MSRRQRPGTAVVLALSLLPFAAVAQETAWTPPPPAPEVKDWVQLVSGEWLRGEIKSMRDEVLEFDSEKLDLLLLDWEDVYGIRSSRMLQFVFGAGETAMGPSVLQSGTFTVGTGAELRTFPSAQIISIVEGAESEWDRWSGRLSFGLLVRSGNTEQNDLNTRLFVRREGGTTRFDVNYAGNYGRLSGQQNVNNQLLGAKLSAFVTRRLFVTPIAIELYADEFQNIALRTTLAAGLGYDLLRGAVDWNVQLGGGYVRTKYESAPVGESDDQKSGALIPTMILAWDPTSDIETELKYNVSIGVPEVKDTFHHLTAMLGIDVTSIVDVDFSIAWDRVENPKPGSDGRVPRRDDLRLTFGLGIDY